MEDEAGVRAEASISILQNIFLFNYCMFVKKKTSHFINDKDITNNNRYLLGKSKF